MFWRNTMALDYKTIGSKIQARRRMKGVTQEAMAEALDFSVGFISQVERGVTKLSMDSLYEITQYLDCSIADIVDESNSYNSAYSQVEFNVMYESLTPKDQRLFYYMLEVYTKNKDVLS